MVTIKEMDIVTQVHILNKAVCISHSTSTLGKDMNSIILSPAMDKKVGQSGLFNFGIVTDLEERTLN